MGQGRVSFCMLSRSHFQTHNPCWAESSFWKPGKPPEIIEMFLSSPHPAGRDTLSPNARRSATPLLTVLPTVAELPPVVCFHTLAHCILPVTLDGCLAAAAEAVLPAPSPSRWVVPFGPRPPSLPHPMHILSHIWLNTELGQPG